MGVHFCRLLARDKTPIWARGSVYILTRHRLCDYRLRGGQSAKRRLPARERYPRKIRIGERWFMVRSAFEEMQLLREYLHELEARALAEKPARNVRQRIRYTIKRMQTLAEAQSKARDERIARTNNDLMTIMQMFPWL